MNQIVLKRLTNRRVNMGESPSAAEGENDIAPLSLDAEIVSNACEGVLLQYRTADGSFNRTLHCRSVIEAELAAKADFGIRHDEWQGGGEFPAAPKRNPVDRPNLPRRS